MIPPYTINRTYPYSIDGSVKNITYIIALMVKNKLFHLSNKIKKDKNILHIFIEDEYDSYQEFFNSVVKDEIAYDLNDLELINENGDGCL